MLKSFFNLSLENDVMATSKCCVVSLIFILKRLAVLLIDHEKIHIARKLVRLKTCIASLKTYSEIVVLNE